MELELHDAFEKAGALWLPQFGPFFDTFERYLPADYMYRPTKNEPLMPVGQIVRKWRRRRNQRVADCTAGRDTWPSFLTKAEYR